ncbi:UNVERIFIED_CONTAM: hypothetical protein GTU68_018172 [Idotea baltica]|nr:hypothetical protein [Idotea baltica]
MEYCGGGDLQSLIDNRNGIYFPENRILEWFLQLGLAVRFIHQKHIIHRDIKTQNVFLTQEGRVKLGDFGIAKILEKTSDLANTCIGTPYYLSPEMCENKPYSNKSDIWAVGCVLYEMACLKHAFDASNMKMLILRIIKCSYESIPLRYSRDLRNLVHQIFQREPKFRPSMTSILMKPFIYKRLPRYISTEEATNLKASATRNRNRGRPTDNSMKGSTVRSRIGITGPGAKYGIPASYKQSPSVCLPSTKARAKRNLKSPGLSDNSLVSKSSASKPSVNPNKNKRPCSKKLPPQKDQRLSLNAQCKRLRREKIEAVSSLSNQSVRSHKEGNVGQRNCQNTPNMKLIMKENMSSFKNMNISNSIYKNLDKLEDSILNSGVPNKPGWLVDLYMSKKFVPFNKETDDSKDSHSYIDEVLMNINKGKYLAGPSTQETDQRESFQRKVNSVVKEELVEAYQNAQATREAAYFKEKEFLNQRDNYSSCHSVNTSTMVVVHGRDMVCINDGTFNLRDSKRYRREESMSLIPDGKEGAPLPRLSSFFKIYEGREGLDFRDISPIGKRLNWQPVSTPLFDKNHPLEQTGSNMDTTTSNDFVQVYGNRKQWDNKPRSSIVNILSSAQLMDRSTNRDFCHPKRMKITFNSNVTDNKFCEELDECCPGNEELRSSLPPLESPLPLAEKLLVNPLEEPQFIESEDEAMKLTSLGEEAEEVKNIIQASQAEEILKAKPPSSTFSKNSEDDKTNRVDLKDSTVDKKTKRKFFKFLQKSPQSPASPSGTKSPSGSINLGEGKSKSRFSGLLRKILHRNDSSKTRSCKSLQRDFETLTNSSDVLNLSSERNKLENKKQLKDNYISDFHLTVGDSDNCLKQEPVSERTVDSGVDTCPNSGMGISSSFEETFKNTRESTTLNSFKETFDSKMSANDITYISGLEILVSADPSDTTISINGLSNSNESTEKTLMDENMSGNIIKFDETLKAENHESLKSTANSIVESVLEAAMKQLGETRTLNSPVNNDDPTVEAKHQMFRTRTLSWNQSNMSPSSSLEKVPLNKKANKTTSFKAKSFSSSIVVSPYLLEKIKNKQDVNDIASNLFQSSPPSTENSNLDSQTQTDVTDRSLALAWGSNSLSKKTNNNDSIAFEASESLSLRTESDSEPPQPLFEARSKPRIVSSSKSSLSEGESQDVANFRESLENLLADDGDEVFINETCSDALSGG